MTDRSIVCYVWCGVLYVVRYRFAAGGIHTFHKDTFAENPADRKNLILTEDVNKPIDSSIRPIGAVYASMIEGGTELQYVRLPIVDERSPSLADFDQLVDVLKSVDEKTATFFNCQMGKGRTTTGMVCAVLMRRVLDPNNKEPEPADYNEASPDYVLGQYKVIMKLVEALSKGTPESAAAAATTGGAAPAPIPVLPATANGAPPAAADDKSAVDVKSAPTAAPAVAGDEKAAPAAAAGGAAAASGSIEISTAGSGGAASGASTAHKENGEVVKAEVDDACDKCKAMQHLRSCIFETREKYNKESSADRKQFWKDMSRNFLER